MARLPPGCTWPAPTSTADPRAVRGRAVAAGATIEREPDAETDYGSLEVAFRDPEGNQWSFGTYAGEPRKP